MTRAYKVFDFSLCSMPYTGPLHPDTPTPRGRFPYPYIVHYNRGLYKINWSSSLLTDLITIARVPVHTLLQRCKFRKRHRINRKRTFVYVCATTFFDKCVADNFVQLSISVRSTVASSGSYSSRVQSIPGKYGYVGRLYPFYLLIAICMQWGKCGLVFSFPQSINA